MYDIKGIELLEFLNTEYALPRYQRKETWDYKKNFELAISVFQRYPIGVLIVEEKDISDDGSTGPFRWLLDGRQRREALKSIVYNPTELYHWARGYIGLKKQKCTEKNIEDKFKTKMTIFLENDQEEEEEGSNKRAEGINEPPEAYIKPDKTPTGVQLKSLDALLALIQMVNEVPPTVKEVDGKSKTLKIWESLFDFRYNFAKGEESNEIFDYVDLDDTTEVVSDMPYWEGKQINLRELRKFILNYTLYPGKQNNSEKFVNYCKDTPHFEIEDLERFERMVNHHWKRIKKSVDTIFRANKLFSTTEIGRIKLTNVSPFDSLTIFTRVNSNGVKLNAEELLSSKPFWNRSVKQRLSDPIEDRVETLYKETLQVKQDDKIVRWDVGATLVWRLNDKFIFNEELEKGKFMGFKLLSSIYCGGMSKVDLAELEKRGNEVRVWGGKEEDDDKDKEEIKPLIPELLSAPRIDDLISELKKLLETLSGFGFFKRFARGKMPISRLLGNAPAFEFITIMWLTWKHPPNGKKKKDVDLEREAIRLFDNLVYETVRGQWGHAGDSTMKNHIQQWKNRIAASRPYSDWESLIREAAGSRLELTTGKYADMAPILYYFEALKEKGFSLCNDEEINSESYDIDHIVPQAAFGDGSKYNKDCLANLSLLRHTHNLSKGDTLLNKLEGDLRTAVSNASGIPIEQFEEYSSFNTFEEFVKARTGYLLDFIRVKRKSLTED